MSFTTPVEVSEKVVKTTSTPAFSAQQAVELRRIDLARPTRSPVVRLRAVGLAELDPALAELAARRHEGRLARAHEVGDGRLHRPAARGREDLHLVLGLEHVLEPLQHARVDLDEGRRSVVDHRLGHHLGHGGRQRRRAGGHQVLLDVGIRHERPRIASAPDGLHHSADGVERVVVRAVVVGRERDHQDPARRWPGRERARLIPADDEAGLGQATVLGRLARIDLLLARSASTRSPRWRSRGRRSSTGRPEITAAPSATSESTKPARGLSVVGSRTAGDRPTAAAAASVLW